MEYKLILDTSFTYLVVALATDNKVIDKIEYKAFQRQSEFLIAEIQNILANNKVDIKDIKEILVTRGPGSYTGVRIALTVAKVLNITLNCKVKAISTLKSMVGLNKGLALMDARANRAFVGAYDKGVEILKDQILSIDEIKEFLDNHKDYLVYGDGHLLGLEDNYASLTTNMLELSKNEEPVEDVDALVPQYLKEAL